LYPNEIESRLAPKQSGDDSAVEVLVSEEGKHRRRFPFPAVPEGAC
jgi:hypothetical protein